MALDEKGSLARFCFRRRWLVLSLWIVFATAVVVAGFRFAAPADNDFSGGTTGSDRARALIQRHFPDQRGDSITLVVRATSDVSGPAVRPRVERLLARFGRAPHMVAVQSPYGAPGQISADHRTAVATVRSDRTAIDGGVARTLIADARAAGGGGVRFALDGASVTQVETPYGGPSDGVGGLAAMLVILISFGSLLATGLPLLTALFGIGTGLATVALLGHLLPAPGFTAVVSSLIGFGVGIDYALFIVTRYREGLHDGLDPEHAAVTALATAGRSVVYAGGTVVLAMMGVLVMRQKLLDATAVAASLAVLCTMVTAVTLLPALLGIVGRNIDRLRLPYLGRTAARSPLAERWARAMQRRPLVALLAGAAVMVALAVPALGMRLSFEDSSTQPHDTMAWTAQKWVADGFGAGHGAPLVLVGTGDLTAVRAAVARDRGVASVTPVRPSTDRAAAEFVAFPRTGSQDAATAELVHRLRDTVIPRAAAGAPVFVGGAAAGSIDFADQVSGKLPWLIAVVIGLSLVLLVLLVRSVVIALKAAVMTLLSTAAAYGVLTMVVQHGVLGHQLGFAEPMPITPWVPLFIFPILFGLSTDYEVFLVSRIREEYDTGISTREAVAGGLAHTARVITAAGTIMVVVFASVLLGGDMAVKQFGLGLAVAVLLDATLVRMVLVPSLMELLGRANWWLPGWLARLLPGGRHRPAPSRSRHRDPVAG